MNHILDELYGIPYYTNNSDQIFAWYTVYNDGCIILEENKYSNVNFMDIPKTNIKHFGLYGCGFHLNTNFSNGTTSIYGFSKDKECLLSCNMYIKENKIIRYNEVQSFSVQDIVPFQFKGFFYDSAFNNSIKDVFCVNKYYAGYSCIYNIDPFNKVLLKIYFSLDIIDHPNSIAIIYKTMRYKDSVYPNKFYRYSIAERLYTNFDGKQKVKSKDDSSLINFSTLSSIHKKKIIFSYL